MKWIIEAKYIKSYEIWLRFNDGVEGVVDLESTINNDQREIFKTLKYLKGLKNSSWMSIPSYGKMAWIWHRSIYTI